MTDTKHGGHAPESQEVQIRKIELKWGFFGKLAEHGFKWGSLAFGFWCVKEGWIQSAGTITVADLRAAVSFDSVSSSAPWLLVIFGVGGIAYGRRQAKLRQDTIQRLHPYQEKHEKSIDPNRTSSSLTSRGETRPEDR